MNPCLPASFDGEAFDASMTLKAFAILGFHISEHFLHYDTNIEPFGTLESLVERLSQDLVRNNG